MFAESVKKTQGDKILVGTAGGVEDGNKVCLRSSYNTYSKLRACVKSGDVQDAWNCVASKDVAAEHEGPARAAGPARLVVSPNRCVQLALVKLGPNKFGLPPKC